MLLFVSCQNDGSTIETSENTDQKPSAISTAPVLAAPKLDLSRLLDATDLMQKSNNVDKNAPSLEDEGQEYFLLSGWISKSDLLNEYAKYYTDDLVSSLSHITKEQDGLVYRFIGEDLLDQGVYLYDRAKDVHVEGYDEDLDIYEYKLIDVPREDGKQSHDFTVLIQKSTGKIAGIMEDSPPNWDEGRE
jgi:hypothetical protein